MEIHHNVPDRVATRMRQLYDGTLRGAAMLGAIAFLFLGTPSPAAGDSVRCSRAIASAGATFVQRTLSASERCQDSILRGRFAGPCPDPKTAAKLAKIHTKLNDTIRRTCGGKDRICGVGADDVSLTTVGWNMGQCPNIVGGSPCTNALADCGDVADCLDCVDGTVTSDAVTLAFGAFTVGSPATPIGKCQLQIGKQWSTFLRHRTHTLQWCEDGLLRGKISGPCPDASAARTLARLEINLQRSICRKCGGADQLCGGGDDLTPAAIGFAATCPNVTIPAGASCGGPITTLTELVTCLDCVGQFDSDCVTRLAAPAVVSYPPECLGATSSPTPIATVTATSTGVTATPTPTATPTVTSTATATATPTRTTTSTATPSATATPTPTATSTPDLVPPTVSSTNPANGAIGICTNQTLTATFDEPMDAATITTVTFTLKATAGGSVTGVVSYDVPTNTASFDPDVDLTGTPATNYTATIKGGVGGVTDAAGNPLAADEVTTFTTNGSTCAPAQPLGAAAPFAGFGGSATVTNDGLATVIHGDIGVDAASTQVTGLHDSGGNTYTTTPNNSGLVTGLIYTLTAPPGSVAGASVTQAHSDALAAFNAISPGNLPGGIDVSSLAQCPSCGGAGGGSDELAGRILPPGVYRSTPIGTYDIGGAGRTVGDLTLDAGGDTNAVWVFQTTAGTGTLNVGLTGPSTPAVPIHVLLINGAQAKNVFWYVPAGATIGTGSTMTGTMLANASITISTTGGSPPTAVVTTLNGRAIALTAASTMVNTVINIPAP
jgi:hypothetical protein